MIGDVNAFVQEIVVTSASRHLRCVRHCSALLCIMQMSLWCKMYVILYFINMELLFGYKLKASPRTCFSCYPPYPFPALRRFKVKTAVVYPGVTHLFVDALVDDKSTLLGNNLFSQLLVPIICFSFNQDFGKIMGDIYVKDIYLKSLTLKFNYIQILLTNHIHIISMSGYLGSEPTHAPTLIAGLLQLCQDQSTVLMFSPTVLKLTS